MKKLLTLAIALVFSAGVSFAQSSEAIVTQAGDTNKGTVTQSGSDQYGKIEQSSDLNEAVISQSGGTGNDAYIRQNGDENKGTITQVGSNNKANSETAPGLDIGGDKNYTNIYQEGTGNIGRISVTGDENGDLISDNAFEVTQVGSQNRGEVFMVGDGNQGFVDQSSGDRNYVNFNAARDGARFGGRSMISADDNVLEFTQTGSDAVVRGFLAGDRNEVYVNQEGGNYIGSISPSVTDGIFVYGDDNDIFVDQMMSGNHATVSIDGAVLGDRGNLNVVDVNQTTAGNTATVNVMGSGNTSTINQ